MSDETKQSLPQIVIDEAWSEYLYPRAAVGDLSHPSEHGGFVRAMRVIQQWATEHDAWWKAASATAERSALERAALELERRANQRQAVGGDDSPECDGECESSDCHTVSAVAAYSMAAALLRRRAGESGGVS